VSRNGIYAKRILSNDKVIHFLNNEKLLSSRYTVPLFSIIYKFGLIFDVNRLHNIISDFLEIFQNNFIIEHGEGFEKECLKFKKEGLNDFMKDFIRYFESNVLIGDFTLNFYEMELFEYLMNYLKMNKFRKLCDANLFIFNDNPCDTESIYQKALNYKFITDLRLFEIIKSDINSFQTDEFDKEAVNYLPFKTSHFEATVEKMVSSFTLVKNVEIDSKNKEVEILYNIIKNRDTILNKLKNEKILLSFFSFLMTDLTFKHYRSFKPPFTEIITAILEKRKQKISDIINILNEDIIFKPEYEEYKEVTESVRVSSQYSEINKSNKNKKCSIY
jgi:hypothetical protein